MEKKQYGNFVEMEGYGKHSYVYEKLLNNACETISKNKLNKDNFNLELKIWEEYADIERGIFNKPILREITIGYWKLTER